MCKYNHCETSSDYVCTIQFAHVRFWFSGKVRFWSLFVKHMRPWACYVCHGKHKVHNAYNALTLFRFGFLS